MLCLLCLLVVSSTVTAAGSPPAAPSNLNGTLIDGRVTLSWDIPEDDDGVSGYNVYRDNQYLSTVTDPSFIDTDNGDVSHSWYIVAFDVQTNFSAQSMRIVLPDPGPVDTTLPPSVPTALQGSVESGEQSDAVRVTWQASTDDQSVAGYNIYQNREYIATRPVPVYEGFVDAGSSNSFSVVAFDFDRNFSTTSESLTLPMDTPGTVAGVALSVPAGLSGEAVTANGETRVELTWQVPDSDSIVTGYNVYRDNDYLSTVFDTRFTDIVAAGAAFAYSVAAFDDFGNFSARSASVSVFADANQPPFFSGLMDQNLNVGQSWELLLRPIDPDGGAAGILAENLPAGATLVDNQDGSRTLLWTPDADDIGVFTINVIAFDLADAALRTSQTITLSVNDGEPQVASSFSLTIAQVAYNLREGNPDGLTIPITVNRTAESTRAINVSVEAAPSSDSNRLSASFSQDRLEVGDAQTQLKLTLDIGVLPILPQQRSFRVTATDGTQTHTVSVTVAVTPVQRDDVYLLIGQSNMVGTSEDGAKQAGAGGLDEPNLRIRQANVANNNESFYPTAEAYTDLGVNFSQPAIVTAQDPLHEPIFPDTVFKEGTRIGMGLSFAKTALPATSRNIVLVPAAWGATGFCDASERPAHWNSDATAFTPADAPVTGDTLLLDRALFRVNQTLLETGGILRGIIWHQGEEDSRNQCAPLYQANLQAMVAALRTQIIEDARGSGARGADANVPFVAGTMSRGNDPREDLSNFSPAKTTVDNAHRNIASSVPFSEVVLTDDLIPANGYPCGEASCIHFGAAALREMGARAYDALIRAAGN